MFFCRILYLLIPTAMIMMASGCSRTINEPVSTTRNAVREPQMLMQEMPREVPVKIPIAPSNTLPRHESSQLPEPVIAPDRNIGMHMNTPSPVRSITQSPMQIPTPPQPQANTPATVPVQQSQQSRELASHETEFNAKETNRSNNISRAAKSINGHIVQPGETFSYNKTVGPTNQRRGYKKSTIFVEGEKKKGVGGGVCQVSTTLFNAAEDAGMTILERHDHSLPVTYAKSGEEAATSYGGIDFKFKNEKPYPIVIHCAVSNGKIKVTINAV